ncbi:3-keto-5-aminohexanoate cleavage protein [Aminobacter sp. MDW-2]|uniref:3-keto-5-aminohexanoate cleavage protein n=1 Tax=Aminobacter sp. MDW-2 TaxID=2666139 RepID=UPI0012B106EE|nr:3-keto-5-aminohexanoate cleavage protein [Aminobacter sp. MDW-2]MRX37398.1 3-keto-5-aminohexanoate cleavage protein [Aminobacter sp. MDW-2]QNH37864.1 3-keto-5-aminohexanoate cleavage protein [Aminobacter sp. MDW-2]
MATTIEPKRRWIEVALNGPWGPTLQPGAPITIESIVEEGIAAAKAGASIVHFHAYDENAGKQKDDWQLYARIIEGIRSQADVIAYPTIPLAGSGLGSDEPLTAQDRLHHIDELGRRGLIEWAVCDPGTVNFCRFDRIAAGDLGFIYLNPGDHIREGLKIAAAHRIRPSFAIYEPGFSRLGAAAAAAIKNVPTPIYRFMFSDEFAWGFPPRSFGLTAHLALLSEVAPGAPWMIAGLGVDVGPLVEETLERGGHVRVGLEDARFGTDRTNLNLVEEAAVRIRTMGYEPATAAEIREALRLVDAAS